MRLQTLLFAAGNVLTAAHAFVNPHIPAITPGPGLNARQDSSSQPPADSTVDLIPNAACTSSIFSYVSEHPQPELDGRVVTLFDEASATQTAGSVMNPWDICSVVNYHIYAPPPRVKLPKSLTATWSSFSIAYLRWAFQAKSSMSSIGTRCLQEHSDTMGALSAMLMAATDIPSCREAFKVFGDDYQTTATGVTSTGGVGPRETGMAVMGAVAAAGAVMVGAITLRKFPLLVLASLVVPARSYRELCPVVVRSGSGSGEIQRYGMGTGYPGRQKERTRYRSERRVQVYLYKSSGLPDGSTVTWVPVVQWGVLWDCYTIEDLMPPPLKRLRYRENPPPETPTLKTFSNIEVI
ncbi:hypothetical protein QBC44DRAFT_354263 [Cladorrhinum sp. PSN332]|nr:hypothetical protein QBC44DRAFT_354263 [Cladorrhinum sp. PSN332]